MPLSAAVLSLSAWAAAEAPPCRPSAAAEKALSGLAAPALVHVGPGYGGGGGFLVSEDGLVLTNAHNIELPSPAAGKPGKRNSSRLPASGAEDAVDYIEACFGPSCPLHERLEGGLPADEPGRLLAEVLRVDHGRDLALLRLVDPGRSSWPRLSFVAEDLRRGGPVALLDPSPASWAKPWAGWIVDAEAPPKAFPGHDKLAPGFRGQTTNARSCQGFSGAPALDYCAGGRGEALVAGVLFGGDHPKCSKKLSYLVPASSARAFLEESETLAAARSAAARAARPGYAENLRARELAHRRAGFARGAERVPKGR